MKKQTSKSWQVITLILTLALMLCAAWFVPLGINWLCVSIALALFITLVSFYVTGRPGGIFVNERNLMSLGRFQAVIWTVIILSAYLTIVFARLKAGTVQDPLGVALDWHLWALMGISTTSLVGTPLLLNEKKAKQPDPKVLPKTAADLNESQQQIIDNKEGILYANDSASDAAFTDMFQGDELQNTAQMDLAKVQMFLFTIIVALTYCVILFNTLKEHAPDPTGLEALPSLSDGMVALIGISHAGYLTSKTVTHTKTV